MTKAIFNTIQSLSTGKQVLVDELFGKDELSSASVTSATGTQTLTTALNARANKSDAFLTSGLTVNIPTDYPNLQDAVNDLSSKRPSNGAIIDLMIESGHSPASGLEVNDGDYSYFRISSVDAEVTLDPSFPRVDVIRGNDAKMPILNCLINANSLGLDGYSAQGVSTGVIKDGCGIKNSYNTGLHARSGAVVQAGGSIWTGGAKSGEGSGLMAWAATISAFGANCDDSGYYGAQAAASGTLYFRSGTANNAVRHGVRATNAALVNAREASAQNCGTTGFRSFDGGVMHAQLANASGSVLGFYAEHASSLNAREGIANNCSSAGVQAIGSSNIDFWSGSATGCGDNAITANNASVVNAELATIDSANSRTVSSDNGSTINLKSASVTSNAPAGSNNAPLYSSGGTITAVLATVTSANTEIVNALDGGHVNMRGATISWSGAIAITHNGGSYIVANNTGVTDSEINGTLNTVAARGIVFG